MSTSPRQLTPELGNYNVTIFDAATHKPQRSNSKKGKLKRPPQDQLSAEKDSPPKISRQSQPQSPEPVTNLTTTFNMQSQTQDQSGNSPWAPAMPLATDRDTKPKALRQPNKDLHKIQCIYSEATRTTIIHKDANVDPPPRSACRPPGNPRKDVKLNLKPKIHHQH